MTMRGWVTGSWLALLTLWGGEGQLSAQAPKSPNLSPPDSVRPAATTTPTTPPSNAVAQCVDGTFIVAPNDPRTCASHGGTRVVLPHASTPHLSPARSAAKSQGSVAASAVPPAGATMRCKDGTYLSGPPAAGRCDPYGGLASLLPANGKPAPPPHHR